MKRLLFIFFLCIGTLAFGQGGGLVLYEVGNTGLGNSSAGASALARDASAVYTNPASITELERNYLSVGLELLPLKVDLNVFTPEDNGQRFPNDFSGGGTSGSAAVYWAHRLNEKFSIGATLNAVAASNLNYDTDWVGRYIVSDALLAVVNLAPTVGYRLNDKWSFGLALNIYYSLVDANLRLANPTADPVRNYETDYNINLDVKDVDVGFTAGIHYRPTEKTRFGLTYRLGNTFDYGGDVKVTDVDGSDVGEDEVNITRDLDAEIPIVNGINLGFAQRLGDFDLLADVGWSDWSRFEDIPITIQLDNNIDAALPEDWNDTWHFGVGANYYLNNDWTFQAGISYDSSAVDDDARTINVPTWAFTRIACGAIYNIKDKFDVGLHYSYGAADEGGTFSMLDNYSSFGVETLTGNFEKVSLQCILLTFSYKY